MLITHKETIKKSTNRYIKFVEIAFGLIRNSRIPESRRKRSVAQKQRFSEEN
jgi:hypothetical protein